MDNNLTAEEIQRQIDMVSVHPDDIEHIENPCYEAQLIAVTGNGLAIKYIDNLLGK